MNEAHFSVSLQQMGESQAFEMEVDPILSIEETLIPDARAGMTPSDMVERKVLAALGSAAARDHTRAPGQWGQRPGIRPRGRGAVARGPAADAGEVGAADRGVRVL